jgi:phospholipid/cholesterol/gamma-HCH transport system ATP-binding protein
MNAAAPVISVENVTIAYGENVIQENVSFDVRAGEVFVILGGSGSGKSSLLKVMIGLYPPVAGRILFDGENIVTAEGDDRLRLLRKFGVMYQSGALFGSMTVLENVRLPLDEFTDLGPEEKDLVAAVKLNQVGLLPAAARKPSALSGGMQKRAGIARAMALDPGILFLDEPSTHELQSIYAIADRCIMLDGRTHTLIAEGKPADLRDHSKDPYVRQFFLRQAEPAGNGNGGGRAS